MNNEVNPTVLPYKSRTLMAFPYIDGVKAPYNISFTYEDGTADITVIIVEEENVTFLRNLIGDSEVRYGLSASFGGDLVIPLGSGYKASLHRLESDVDGFVKAHIRMVRE